MAHAPSCAKAAALPDGPTRFQVKTTSPNGSVPKPSTASVHTSENWVASRRLLSRISLAVADDAELDGIVAAIQFGHCSQKPLLGRTVRLDGDVEGVAPVEGDDQRVSGLLLRRTELRPVRDGALGSCSGFTLCGGALTWLSRLAKTIRAVFVAGAADESRLMLTCSASYTLSGLKAARPEYTARADPSGGGDVLRL